jgi:hypothetical protein
VPPGRCVVLRAVQADALWVTSWPRFAQHAWRGAWINSLFRNESVTLSSSLIRQAVAVTRALWPAVPPLGMVTFVDPRCVRSRNPGYCYRCAGFRRVGSTRSRGLVVLQLLPAAMPPPLLPNGLQLSLWSMLSD